MAVGQFLGSLSHGHLLPSSSSTCTLPVRGGAGPGEILRGQRGGPRCHGLLDGCFLAVGFEE